MNTTIFVHQNKEAVPTAAGQISKNGETFWLDIQASGTTVDIFFSSKEQLAEFCEKHNFDIQDNSELEGEEGE